MSAKDTIKHNKTSLHTTLCGDYRLILTKVYENNLITSREYNNLKCIRKEDLEGHVVELVDKIINKGEDTCRAFLSVLQKDQDVKATFPQLKNLALTGNHPPHKPPQASCSDDVSQEKDEPYQITRSPVGICLIINNMNFFDGTARTGSNRDANCLAEVFTWLGFRVLMCKDQTKQQMENTLEIFGSLSDAATLKDLNITEFCGNGFTDLQDDVANHGDVFVCCVLSHGAKGVVLGVDSQSVPIKQMTRTFKASDQSPLTGRPKVFLIQACQGVLTQRGVLLPEIQSDDYRSLFIPEEADILVAMATVEDCAAMRHKKNVSWFIQSVCKHLKEGCPRGEDVVTILHRVNDEVSQQEASPIPGKKKQMPEVRFTLRKKLVLSPQQI
nr:caspase-8-like isoform X2 [Doryrhamphus excisus]XP_057923349.1 caspase-8-like isoform X2 [Doryrhamphus excisus]XP_057923350.1 caspase-8-like isoform X2 [Doryrhamphus excisus]